MRAMIGETPEWTFWTMAILALFLMFLPAGKR
jgi:hypothetical protein